MSGFGLRKNTVFEWNGDRFRIDRVQADGDVVIERLDDGVFSIAKERSLFSEYVKGAITVPEAGLRPASNIPAYGRPLDDLPACMRTEAARRRRYLEAVLAAGKPVFMAAYLKPLLKDAALKIGDETPPSISSFYRWYQRYRQHGDFRCLVPRWDRRGSRDSKQAARIGELLLDVTAEAYLASPIATVANIFKRLGIKIDAANRAALNGEQLKLPNVRTVYRMLARLPAIDRYQMQHGKAATDKRFRMSLTSEPKSGRILLCVQIDHTPLDLFLVDEVTGLPFGRPILTVVIDEFSRMLLGYYLSYGHPSAAAVMGALRHAILPKERAAVVIPHLKTEQAWSCYGTPESAVLDNGLEFHGRDLESVAFDLGIHLVYCPKHQPRFKGAVERFLKTINYSFAGQLPGASLAKLHLRGDYDPQKHAVLTFAEFKQVFEKWVVDVYAQRVHKGLGVSPWSRWNEGLRHHQPTLPGDINVFRRRIGLVAERQILSTGITLHGIRYASVELQALAGMYGMGVSVRVVYDPEDLGEIQVWGPQQDEPVTVLAVDLAGTRGRTLYQQQLILKQLKAAGKSTEDADAVRVAEGQIYEVTSELMKSRKQRDRARVARTLGVSSSKPQSKAMEHAKRPVPSRKSPPPRPPVPNVSPDELPPTFTAFKMKPKRGEEP